MINIIRKLKQANAGISQFLNSRLCKIPIVCEYKKIRLRYIQCVHYHITRAFGSEIVCTSGIVCCSRLVHSDIAASYLGTRLRHRMGNEQKMPLELVQLKFVSTCMSRYACSFCMFWHRNAEVDVPQLFWPVNCIKIVGHVALTCLNFAPPPSLYYLLLSNSVYLNTNNKLVISVNADEVLLLVLWDNVTVYVCHLLT